LIGPFGGVLACSSSVPIPLDSFATTRGYTSDLMFWIWLLPQKPSPRGSLVCWQAQT
jgi:hypothetical protein